MKPFAIAFLMSSVCLAHPVTVNTVSGSGSAKTAANSSFTFAASAQKIPQANNKFAYLGSLSLQTYVGHDYVQFSVPKWSQGTWTGNQATLIAWTTVKVSHAGKTTTYQGVSHVLFVDNKHGQNSTASNPPPCDCVCLSWKDKYSSLSYNFLGTVQRGGTAIVK